MATYRKLKDSIEVIRSFPDAGRIPDELGELGTSRYRQVISGRNRIIYEVAGQIVYIHIVCDTRRHFQTLLNQRLVHSAGLGRSRSS